MVMGLMITTRRPLSEMSRQRAASNMDIEVTNASLVLIRNPSYRLRAPARHGLQVNPGKALLENLLHLLSQLGTCRNGGADLPFLFCRLYNLLPLPRPTPTHLIHRKKSRKDKTNKHLNPSMQKPR